MEVAQNWSISSSEFLFPFSTFSYRLPYFSTFLLNFLGFLDEITMNSGIFLGITLWEHPQPHEITRVLGDYSQECYQSGVFQGFPSRIHGEGSMDGCQKGSRDGIPGSVLLVKVGIYLWVNLPVLGNSCCFLVFCWESGGCRLEIPILGVIQELPNSSLVSYG